MTEAVVEVETLDEALDGETGLEWDAYCSRAFRSPHTSLPFSGGGNSPSAALLAESLLVGLVELSLEVDALDAGLAFGAMPAELDESVLCNARSSVFRSSLSLEMALDCGGGALDAPEAELPDDPDAALEVVVEAGADSASRSFRISQFGAPPDGPTDPTDMAIPSRDPAIAADRSGGIDRPDRDRSRLRRCIET